MAYRCFALDHAGGAGASVAARPPVVATIPARFTPLEWSVVALARRDRLSSLRTPGPIAVVLRALFGGRRDARLADPRLEALRRMAVLSWHYGYTVPSQAVKDFLIAGFSPDQYELLVDATQARSGGDAIPALRIVRSHEAHR